MKIKRLRIETTEPVSITDLYNSKDDEASALSYLNGASLRGAVMNRAADEGKLTGDIKKAFFDGRICFRNAYPQLQIDGPVIKAYDTVPVPKGYYEDRDQNGEISHSFSAVHDGSRKRAKVGQYASLENEQEGILLFMTPMMGETFRTTLIRKAVIEGGEEKGKQKIFRGSFLEKGQVFTGSVAFSDDCPEDIISYVVKLLTSPGLKLGSMRGSGCGGVKVTLTQMEDMKETRISEAVFDDHGKYYVDLFCVSNLCMVNTYGEPCGLDEDALAEMLGVPALKVVNSAASVTHVCSFNRILGGRSAEFPVFEGGSIFRLEMQEAPEKEKLLQLEEQGIGIKREEGLGQVRFLSAIDKMFEKKQKCTPVCMTQNSNQELAEYNEYLSDLENMKKMCAQMILQRKMEAASTDYVIGNPLKDDRTQSSQRGVIVTLCKSLRYEPEKAMEEFHKYFLHSELKDAKTQKYRENYKPRKGMFREVQRLLEADLLKLLNLEKENICGYSISQLLTPDKIMQYKLELIIDLMRYTNRSGKEV